MTISRTRTTEDAIVTENYEKNVNGTLTHVTTTTKPRTKRSRQPVQHLTPAQTTFDDGSLVTVLYGYGRVPLDKISWLDDYEVRGGVIKDVPYAIAKHWEKGTRPDGKRPQGRVSVKILPKDATERDYAQAVGLSEGEMARLASFASSSDLDALIGKLTPTQLHTLRQSLDARLR